MRKQFNLQDWLKDKSQRVETRDGRPVKIISFEMTDTNDCPIAAQFRLCAGTPVVYLFDKEGYYKGEGDSDYDLFIVTPEEELSEFEIRLLDWLSDDTSGEIPMERMKEVVRNRAAELRSLVKEEFENEAPSIIETQSFREGFKVGEAKAMKDLPRWNDSRWIYEDGWLQDGFLYYRNHSILLKDLEKLPGFKED